MRKLLTQQPFSVPPYNAHYEGSYDARTLEWRRLGAADKAANLAFLLSDAGPVDSVLEVGCGTGAVVGAVAMAGIGREHAGVDLADPGEHRDPDAAGIALTKFDGKSLPFADRSFDLVFASHVIEHVPDPRATLADMARVTRRWLYLEVPCELHVRTNVKDLQRSLNIGHINAYTPESFRLLVESSGLRVERLGVFDHSLAVHCFGPGKLRGWIKLLLRRGLLALGPRLASRVFTFHVGILAERS